MSISSHDTVPLSYKLKESSSCYALFLPQQNIFPIDFYQVKKSKKYRAFQGRCVIQISNLFLANSQLQTVRDHP